MSKDFIFHFEGVNALFSKLRRAVETLSSLSASDMEPGGVFRTQQAIPVVTLDKAKDGRGGRPEKDKQQEKKSKKKG